MSLVTGMAVGGAIVLLGAIGMMLLGMTLANREEPRRVADASLALTRDDAQRLIALINTLTPLKDKLHILLADTTSANDASPVPK